MIRLVIYTLLVQSLLMVSAEARSFLGGVNGGGGTSIVCRDDRGSIETAELLDIFEARQLGLRLESLSSLLDYYKLFMTRWLKFQGANAAPESDQIVQGYLNKILGDIWFINHPLPDTKDYQAAFPVPEGCTIEQVAIYNDGNVQMMVNSEIWNAMDDQNKMALLGHEIIYRNYRLVNGISTSNEIRTLNGFIFSANYPLK